MQALAPQLAVQALTQKWCHREQDASSCWHSHENGVAGLGVVDAGQALARPHVSPHHAGIARAILRAGRIRIKGCMQACRHAGRQLWNGDGDGWATAMFTAITSPFQQHSSSSRRSLLGCMQVCSCGMGMGGPQSFKVLSWASASSSRHSPQLYTSMHTIHAQLCWSFLDLANVFTAVHTCLAVHLCVQVGHAPHLDLDPDVHRVRGLADLQEAWCGRRCGRRCEHNIAVPCICSDLTDSSNTMTPHSDSPKQHWFLCHLPASQRNLRTLPNLSHGQLPYGSHMGMLKP